MFCSRLPLIPEQRHKARPTPARGAPGAVQYGFSVIDKPGDGADHDDFPPHFQCAARGRRLAALDLVPSPVFESAPVTDVVGQKWPSPSWAPDVLPPLVFEPVPLPDLAGELRSPA